MFLLVERFSYQFSIAGIFSTREAAEEFAIKRGDPFGHWEIEHWDLDTGRKTDCRTFPECLDDE